MQYGNLRLNKRFRLGFTALCFLLLQTGISSQTTVVVPPPATPSIQVRIPAEQQLRQLRARPEYAYGRFRQLPQTVWDTFKGWLQEQIRRALNSRVVNTSFDILYYLIILFMAITVTMYMLRLRVRGLLGSDAPSGGEVSLPEELTPEDFLANRNAASARGHYAEALRWHYLLLIRHYAGNGIFGSAETKTALQIAAAIPDTTERQRFNAVSAWYEYVWYGGRSIGRQEYEALAATQPVVPSLRGRHNE